MGAKTQQVQLIIGTMLCGGPGDIALTILHAVEIVFGIRLAHRQGIVPVLLNAPGHCSTRYPEITSGHIGDLEYRVRVDETNCDAYCPSPQILAATPLYRIGSQSLRGYELKK
jgi:hypothetical protein